MPTRVRSCRRPCARAATRVRGPADAARAERCSASPRGRAGTRALPTCGQMLTRVRVLHGRLPYDAILMLNLDRGTQHGAETDGQAVSGTAGDRTAMPRAHDLVRSVRARATASLNGQPPRPPRRALRARERVTSRQAARSFWNARFSGRTGFGDGEGRIKAASRRNAGGSTHTRQHGKNNMGHSTHNPMNINKNLTYDKTEGTKMTE